MTHSTETISTLPQKTKKKRDTTPLAPQKNHNPPAAHSYDSCDVGTFPNQTDKDQSGPAAALHSDASKAKYNFDLSWLSGQKLSCVRPLERS